ncbi:MAG: type II toxin-antitoxin system RelE/ParE family toxin [Terriglobales bacterium]
MSRIVWTRSAEGDLHRLHRFLAQHDSIAAARAITAIVEGVSRLAIFPALGRPAHDMPSEYRECFISFGDSGYLILYRVASNRIAVLAIRHGRESGYE